MRKKPKAVEFVQRTLAEIRGDAVYDGASDFRDRGLYDAWFAGLCLGMETGAGRATPESVSIPGVLVEFSAIGGEAGDSFSGMASEGKFLSMNSASADEKLAYASGMGAGIRSSSAGDGRKFSVALEMGRRIADSVGVDFGVVAERAGSVESAACSDAVSEMRRSIRESGSGWRKRGGKGKERVNIAAAGIAIVGMFSVVWASPGLMRANESRVVGAFSSEGEGMKQKLFEGGRFEPEVFALTMEKVLGSEWRSVLERDDCFQVSLSRVAPFIEPSLKKDIVAELTKSLDDIYAHISSRGGDLHPANHAERKSVAKVASLRSFLAGDVMEALAFEVVADPGNPSLLEWLAERNVDPFDLVRTYVDGFSPKKGGKYGVVAEFVEKMYGTYSLGREAVGVILYAETTGGILDFSEATALNGAFGRN